MLITEAFGGIATYTEFLVQELHKIKFIKTRILHLFNPQNYQKENIRKFIPQTRNVLDLPSSYNFKDPLMKIIRQDPSEIIHFQYDMSIFPSRNYFLKLLGDTRRQTSKKIVITIHSLYTDSPFIKMINDCLMFTNACIVHQGNAKNFLVSKGMEPSKIFVIPHGSAIIKPASDKTHFFKKNMFKIAMVGFLKKTKAFEQALSSIITKSDLEIIVAGMVKENEVTRQIERLQQKAKATLTIIPRFLTDRELVALIAGADCVILPYEQDYFSSSGILHLAAGMKKIVLVSSSPKFRELTRKIPFCNVKNGNYLKHIEVLQNSPKKVTQLSQKMASFARDTSWSIVAKKTIKLYQSVLLK
ncbi:MAG: glycosyltransferase [Candidatus Hodarchaeales archaeon]|jgi:glycosyltransferase involved in cell wall biosynthesis